MHVLCFGIDIKVASTAKSEILSLLDIYLYDLLGVVVSFIDMLLTPFQAEGLILMPRHTFLFFLIACGFHAVVANSSAKSVRA